MEQVASQCRGGFLRQLLQETTGRLEQGCGVISDAYIHYCLQVTSCVLTSAPADTSASVAAPNNRDMLKQVACPEQHISNKKLSYR